MGLVLVCFCSGCWSLQEGVAARDDGGTVDTETGTGDEVDTGSDTGTGDEQVEPDGGAELECSWEVVFPLDNDPVGRPYVALFNLQDGDVFAASGLGELVIGGSAGFSKIQPTVSDFAAVAAAQDVDGSLLLAGFEGPYLLGSNIPASTDYEGPPKMVRYDGASFTVVPLPSSLCDVLVDIWIGSAGDALALCKNGDVLRRDTTGWTSIEDELPYQQISETEPGLWAYEFTGLRASGPDDVLVYGTDLPGVGLGSTTGLFYHFDGNAWTNLGNDGAVWAHISPDAVWGSGDEIWTLGSETTSVFIFDLVIAHFYEGEWSTEEWLIDNDSNGQFATAYPTKPLLLGDDVFVATKYAIFHGTPDGWKALDDPSLGYPRRIIQGEDGLLYVAYDDGRIFQGTCT